MGAMSKALARVPLPAARLPPVNRPSSGAAGALSGAVPVAPYQAATTPLENAGGMSMPPAAGPPLLDSRGATVMLASPTFLRLRDEAEQRQRSNLSGALGDAEASGRASMAAIAREMQAQKEATSRQIWRDAQEAEASTQRMANEAAEAGSAAELQARSRAGAARRRRASQVPERDWDEAPR